MQHTLAVLSDRQAGSDRSSRLIRGVLSTSLRLPLLALVGLLISVDAVVAQPGGALDDARAGDRSGSGLEAVTVTGSRIPDRFEYVGSTLVVRRETIEAAGANSIADVLRILPGVQVTTTPGGSTEIRLRGMPAQSTRILIDGSPVSSARKDVQLPVDELPADLVERIEVVRSPSAEYEAAAGGTINIVLRSARRKRESTAWITDQRVWGRDALAIYLAQSGPIGTSAGAKDERSGSPDSDWGYFLSLSGGPRNLGSDSTLTSRSSATQVESISIEQSRIRSVPWTLVSRLSGNGTERDRFTIRSIVSGTSQEGGVAAAGLSRSVTGEVDYIGRSEFDNRREFFSTAIDWSRKLSDGKLDSTLSYDHADTRYGLSQVASDGSSDGAGMVRILQYSEDRNEAGWQLKSRFTRVVGSAVHTFGAEFSTATVDSSYRSTTSPTPAEQRLDAETSNGALYAQIEWPTEFLEASWAAGLRLQQNRIKADGEEGQSVSDNLFVQPSFNMRAPLGAITQARANLAYATRTPRLWELLDRSAPSLGGNSPNSPDFRGNSQLQPEHGLAFDVGIERQLPRGGQAGVGVFARHQQDFISKWLGVVDGRWTERPENVGTAAIWGVEADWRSDLRMFGGSPDWIISGSLNVFNSRMLAGQNVGDRIVGQARYVTSLNVAKPMRLSGGLFGGANLTITGRADLNQPSAVGTDVAGIERSRAQIDLHVGGVIPALGFWRLNIFNVSDVRRDVARSIVDENGVTSASRLVQVYNPRVLLTFGTRF